VPHGMGVYFVVSSCIIVYAFESFTRDLQVLEIENATCDDFKNMIAMS